MKAGWTTKRLEEVAELVGGSTPSRDNPKLWGGDIPWVTPTDLPMPGEGIANISTTTQAITRPGLDSCAAALLPPETVLFSSRATIGKLGIAETSLTTNQGFVNFIPRQGIHSRFLAYSLWFHKDGIAKLAGSTTFKEVSRGNLRKFTIAVPPLSEQERIVCILDEAEELRKLRAQADRRTADLIPALFHDMFGNPTTNAKGWPVAFFGEVGECRLGKMLDAKQQTGQYRRPYLRNVNVQWGRFDLSDVLEMDFDERSRELLRLRHGDVLICEGGEVGRSAIWNDELPECYFQKALHRARPDPKLAVPEFIQWLMWSLAKSGGLSDFTTQATIAHLTGIKLKSLRIPVPPVPLQRQFATYLAEVRAMEAQQAASRRRIDDLFQSLLDRAFKGEL